jgi:hypothetical protein
LEVFEKFRRKGRQSEGKKGVGLGRFSPFSEHSFFRPFFGKPSPFRQSRNSDFCRFALPRSCPNLTSTLDFPQKTFEIGFFPSFSEEKTELDSKPSDLTLILSHCKS